MIRTISITQEATAANPYEADAVTEAYLLPYPYYLYLYRLRPLLAVTLDPRYNVLASALVIPKRTTTYGRRKR